MQIKTHKANGKIKGRPVHDGAATPFTPVGKYISRTLETMNEKEEVLLKDSTHTILKLQNEEIDDGMLIVAFNIKD